MLKRILNFLLLPVRLIFSHEFVNKLGLTSMRDERYDIVKKNCKGRLLDIGCGNNELVKMYGNNSVGVDVFDFGGNALIIKDSSKLPFNNSSFDTVGFVACLNHIGNRESTIEEAYRVLSAKGYVIITMISPLIGLIRHKLAWWDRDQNDRGMEEGEKMGLTSSYILYVMKKHGFALVKQKKFILGLNNIYVFQKK